MNDVRSCGEIVGGEWVSYLREPGDPEALRWHFGGIVRERPEEPRIERARETTRDFRYPDDLDVFFHCTCAPRVELPEKMKEESASMLSDALVADLLKTHGNWDGVHKAFASGKANKGAIGD